MRIAGIVTVMLAAVILVLSACAAPAVTGPATQPGPVSVPAPLKTAEPVLAPEPAGFVTSDLTISTAECNIEGDVWVSVKVTNVGGQPGTYPVVVKVNDVVTRTQDVTLAAGDSERVWFVLSQKDDLPEFITYKVRIDDLARDLTVL